MTLAHPLPNSPHRAQRVSRPDGDFDTIAINTIRTLAIDAVEKAHSSHAGAPIGLAPVAYTLWRRFHPDPGQERHPQLQTFSGFVPDSGESRWTVEAAIEEAAPADVLTTALYARFRSRQEHTFGEKLLSAMRFGFGGHIEGDEPIDAEPTPAASQLQAAE